MRTKRDVSDETAKSMEGDLKQEDVAKVDLVQIVEEEVNGDMKNDNVDKRDAAAEASRLDHPHVLPPPHDIPPHADLPLFPPLGTAPPHHIPHAGPTPVPVNHHHVTISTPTHHVSHGVADHGTHHAVHKEHHQVHHHGHHAAPVVHHHMDHHMSHHHAAPVHHPAPHHHEVHHPHQPAAVPLVMLPPVPAKHYDHPVSGYPKPALGGSLEDIFGLHKPAYHAPEPAYHAPEPAYHAPEPAYHAPEPAYHAPEPAYHAPEPAYHSPEPVYHAPKPAYKPAGPYKPDYKHPTGDYVSPHAAMAGHPFSLEAVFNLDMPLYYMEKYPHMAHMAHHGHHDVHHVVHHPKPTYHEPKPAYHQPKPAYHEPKPAYHEPKSAYHEPKPAYHVPKPAYHEPKPAYHIPEPAYHEPKPAYHAPAYKDPATGYAKPAHGASLEEIFGVHTAYHPHPKPDYHHPEPSYHKPAHGYHEPKHGSLEAVFGLAPTSYVTPAPHYDVPTTYKPKMPDYLHQHPHAKSLPPHHDPGYVLHYLPYDNYKPVHPETLAHPPPVPHHPHAAHMLVPGTHVPPPPHDIAHVPHGFVTPSPLHPHTPLLGVTPAPHAPLLGVPPSLIDHETPILHPHSVLETDPLLHPHPDNLELQPHPAVPVPQPSFLPLPGARKKRSTQSGQSITLPTLLTNNTLATFPFDPDNISISSDFDYFDTAESQIIGLFNTSDVKLIHLCNHHNNQNSSWEPCLIPGGQLSDFETGQNTNIGETTPNLFLNLPKNNFSPIDSNSLPLIRSDFTENAFSEILKKANSETKNPSDTAKVFHTSNFDNFIEETTTSTPFHSTTPGSIPSTPSWLFPTEGNKKHLKTQGFVTDHTSSVYFDPSIRKSFSKL